MFIIIRLAPDRLPADLNSLLCIGYVLDVLVSTKVASINKHVRLRRLTRLIFKIHVFV